jgi:hypothetical protein
VSRTTVYILVTRVKAYEENPPTDDRDRSLACLECFDFLPISHMSTPHTPVNGDSCQLNLEADCLRDKKQTAVWLPLALS